MLNLASLDTAYPSVEDMEPDLHFIIFIREILNSGFYHDIVPVIGMLKYIFKHGKDNYEKEFEILRELYMRYN